MYVEKVKVAYSPGVWADVNLGEYTLSIRGRGYRFDDELRNVLFLSQVHGSGVLHDPPSGAEADGAVMRIHDKYPGIKTADCLPVFLGSSKHLAACHAGWRGLASGIVSRLVEEFPGDPEIVVLGNCICGDCYDVGTDVRKALHPWIDTDEHPEGKVDLKLIALKQLSAAGLCNSARVCDIPECTRCRSDLFYSWRADATESRNLVWLRRR